MIVINILNSKHKADTERVLNSGSNSPISYVKCECIALQPLYGVRVAAHARAPLAAHGICGILKEEREKN